MSDDRAEAGSETGTEQAVREALDAIGQALLTGSGTVPNLNCPAEEQHCQQVLDQVAELQQFILGLGRGDLAQSLSMKGCLAGGLKMLQSNLLHLTWQAKMIAAGDLTQRVDFMGEFSDAFNFMVGSLEENAIERAQRERDLSLANTHLRAEIAERRRAEEAARRANSKLNLLSSITRHDIQNQLMVILGYLEILEETDAARPGQEYLTRITSAATTIRKQIAFTAEYQEIGVTEPHWHRAQGVVERAATTLDLRNIQMTSELGELEIYADNLIEKAFYNLFENALRHGGGVGEIQISSHEQDDHLVLVIRDDGIGIAADKKEQIFGRGFGKNTGLGLFLVRDILGITGITIVETGTEGEGARFEMLVPAGTYRFADL
jgi:signal transduction histidine kinase